MNNRFQVKHRQMSDRILRVQLSKLTKEWQRNLAENEEIQEEMSAISLEMARRGSMQANDNRGEHG